MEMQGIDPCTSRMQSERSSIWATSPYSSCTLNGNGNEKKKNIYKGIRLFGNHRFAMYDAQ